MDWGKKVKCRVCSSEITKKTRSPLRGVCKFDLPHITPQSLYKMTTPSEYGKPVRDVGPESVSKELYERHMRSLVPEANREWEVDLTEEEVKLLWKLRLDAVKKSSRGMAVREDQVQVPVEREAKKMIEVELSDEELKLLERVRLEKLYGVGQQKYGKSFEHVARRIGKERYR